MKGRLLAALALALGACVHVPPADDGLTFEARRGRLAAIDAWRMSGRLAIQAGDEGHLARFRWTQDGETLALNVRAGPFNASSFEIAGKPPVLRVTARGDTWLLGNAETELSEWLGWWLPVESLEFWLLGMPDPGHPVSARMPRGNALASFDQRRWQVRYDQYMLADGVLVPHEIALDHRDLAIEVTVDEWSSPAVSAAGSLN